MVWLWEQKDVKTMTDVLIYTKDYCGYCNRAKDLLDKKGVKYEEIDVTRDADKEAEMRKVSGRDTVPQIFIGGTHIGGCDDLHALDSKGELDKMLGK